MAKEKQAKKRYHLVITPSLEPLERHKIEKALTKLGYNVWAGGTRWDKMQSDISFEK